MRERSWKARRDKLLREESTQPENWWWLSFADADLPKGHQFLGAVLTRANGIATAITKTHLLGINPGGEVAAYQIPDELANSSDCPFKPADHADRLMSKEYIETKLGGAATMPR